MSFYGGIDIGSLATKCVIVDTAGSIVSTAVVPTGARVAQASDSAVDSALANAKLTRAELNSLVATGYGRKRASADAAVTEITCHAAGAFHLFPQTRTVLDIGGQDTKAIRLRPDGEVDTFVMNDKCAAGTGRFLEVMARALEVDLDDFGTLSLQSEKPQAISSFCTVFGESEVVSHLANGSDVKDIARGIHEAVSERVIGLLKRVGLNAQITMSGGVGRNPGMRHALENMLGAPMNVSDNCQFVGALGAALIGRRRALQPRA